MIAVCGVVLRDRALQRDNDRCADELVKRLAVADIVQVPGIVGEMEPYRRWTDPRLNDAFAAAPRHSEQKLHASLGLLPADPSQADYLYDCLLTAQPRDLPVICQALAPLCDRFTEKLWNVVEQPSPSRDKQLLPAACALAAYDAANSRWNAAAAAVAERLLAENPLLLGLWIDALRPVRERLLDPLAKAMSSVNRSESERLTAAGILADYASDRAELLAGLAIEADEKQFALLLPQLKHVGRAATVPLLAEIDSRLTPQWSDPPLGTAAGKADAATLHQIEAAQGVLAEQFAFCQTMPLAAFAPAAESLRKAGYRPIRFRPFAAAEGALVAAVWKRDGQDWRSAAGLSADGLLQQDAKNRAEGFVPVDLSRSFIDHKEQYAALWTRSPGDASPRLLQLGLDDVQVTKNVVAEQKDGYRTMVLDCFDPGDGKRRCSLILAKARDERDHFSQFFLNLEADYAGDNYAGDLEVDVQIDPTAAAADGRQSHATQGKDAPKAPVAAGTPARPSPGRDKNSPPPRLYAAVWHHSTKFASAEVHGLDPAAHLTRCRELIAQQYRPASISVVEFVGGQRVAASVWHRPLATDDEQEKHAKRQAAAAAALLELDVPEKVWPLLAASPDPRLRSYVVDRLGARVTRPRRLPSD